MRRVGVAAGRPGRQCHGAAGPAAGRFIHDQFGRANLRTLQRRVQQWRGIMANKLVYAASEATLQVPDRTAGNGAGGGRPKVLSFSVTAMICQVISART